MLWLTEDADLRCEHAIGKVNIDPAQRLVFVAGRRVLVDPDPEKRPISGCPMYGATVKPCTQSLMVKEGYSAWIRISGQAICLDTVTGLTDGVPPGSVLYKVIEPGQHWVRAEGP